MITVACTGIPGQTPLTQRGGNILGDWLKGTENAGMRLRDKGALYTPVNGFASAQVSATYSRRLNAAGQGCEIAPVNRYHIQTVDLHNPQIVRPMKRNLCVRTYHMAAGELNTLAGCNCGPQIFGL